MSKWMARLIAVGLWLVAFCLALPFAALWSEYTALRDGAPTTGHVVQLARRSTYVDVTVGYDAGGQHRETHVFPTLAEAAPWKAGTPVPLLVSGRGTIRPERVESKRPSILLVAGAALAIVLGALVWGLPTREAARRAASTAPIDVVVEGVRRTRNVAIIATGMFLSFAVFFGVVLGADTEATAGAVAGVGAILVASVGVAIYFLVVALRLRDPRHNPVVDLIERRPEDIAWVYVLETRSLNTGVVVHDLLLFDRRGRRERIRMVSDDAAALHAEIRRRTPGALHGFNPENERRFKEIVAARA